MSKTINSWERKNNKLEREFTFKSFGAAVSFIMDVAKISEIESHHPEIYNYYTKVKIAFSTLDKVTTKDHELSKLIDDLYTERYL